MFPQPKKYGHYVVGLIFAVYAFKNPVQAAELVNGAISAINQFANALS